MLSLLLLHALSSDMPPNPRDSPVIPREFAREMMFRFQVYLHTNCIAVLYNVCAASRCPPCHAPLHVAGACASWRMC